MCRHSSFFYEFLVQYDLLNRIIECCADQDGNVRKFACFAVGNVGFHNDRYVKEAYFMKTLREPEAGAAAADRATEGRGGEDQSERGGSPGEFRSKLERVGAGPDPARGAAAAAGPGAERQGAGR